MRRFVCSAAFSAVTIAYNRSPLPSTAHAVACAIAVQCLPPAALALGVVARQCRCCGDRCGAVLTRAVPRTLLARTPRRYDGRGAELAACKALADNPKKSACAQSLAGAGRTNFSERCHCAELKLKLVRDPQSEAHDLSDLAAYPPWLWLAQCSLSRRRHAHGLPCAGQPRRRVSAPCPRLKRRTPTGARAATRRAS